MDGTFKLEIEMGNDAMQTAEDVATALIQVAAKLKRGQATGEIELDEGKVYDANGNYVGDFALEV